MTRKVGTPVAAEVTFVQPSSGEYLLLECDIVKAEEHNVSAQVTTHPVQEGANITDHVRPNLKRVSLQVRVTNSPIDGTGSSRKPSASGIGGYSQISVAGRTSKQVSYANISGGYPPLTVPNQVPIFGGVSAPTLGFPRPFIAPKTVGGEKIDVPVNLSAWAIVFDDVSGRVKSVWNTWAQLCLRGIPIEVNSDLYHYPRMLITSVGTQRDGTNGLTISVELQELRTARTSKTFINVKAKKPKEKRAEPTNFQGKKGEPYKLKTKTSMSAAALRAGTSGPNNGLSTNPTQGVPQ